MIPRHKRAHRGGATYYMIFAIFMALFTIQRDLEWNVFSMFGKNRPANMARARLIAANLTMEHIWLTRVINDKKALSPVDGDLKLAKKLWSWKSLEALED